MTFLIFGKNGQLGSCLVDLLDRKKIKYIALSKKEADITDKNKVEYIIGKYKPTTVINAAAYTQVRESESNPNIAFEINQNGIKNIAIACNKIDCNLIHVSTDYVFDGKSSIPYTPEMNTNPLNIYGKSKLQGEIEIKLNNSKFIILRTSWVFSEYGKNFVKTMIKTAKEKNTINVVSDQIGTPSYAGDIAEAILNLNTKFDGSRIKEIYHYAGSPICSWHDFAETVFKILFSEGLINEVPKLTPISSSSYNDGLERPIFSALSSEKYFKEFKILESDWRKSLKKITAKL